MGTSAQRVLFIGGRELGARCLRHLVEVAPLVACVIARNDEVGVGVPTGPDVISIAVGGGIPWIAPENLKTPEVADWVRNCAPDIGFCTMFPRAIPGAVLELPERGVFNLHGASLPAYRGCLGHAWAIINSENTYGVTIHRMSERLDAGPVVARAEFDVDPSETGTTLHAKAVGAAYALFERSIRGLLSGDLAEVAQDERLARYYTKAPPFGRVIQWGWSAVEIESFLRAMEFRGIPRPHSFVGGSVIEVLAAAAFPAEARLGPLLPGVVVRVDDGGATVQTGSGLLLVEAVQVVPGHSRCVVVKGREIGSLCPPGSRMGR